MTRNLLFILPIAALALAGCSKNQNEATATSPSTAPGNVPSAQSQPARSREEQIERYKKMQEQSRTQRPNSP